MWSWLKIPLNAFVVTVVVSLIMACTVVAADCDAGEDNSICAMTEVLVVMKTLLVTFNDEIRDLRKQVRDSCQPAPQQDCAKDTTALEDDIDQKIDGNYIIFHSFPKTLCNFGVVETEGELRTYNNSDRESSASLSSSSV